MNKQNIMKAADIEKANLEKDLNKQINSIVKKYEK
jgi:hypothetical protein